MIINAIKKVLPLQVKIILISIWNFKRDFYLKNEIKKVRASQVSIVDELRRKEKINVIFLVIHDSVWKYEEVYKLLDKDPRFRVQVVVIPLVRNGKGVMDVYNQTLNYFLQNGYCPFSSFDLENNIWLDIKTATQPDIVFFTNPHPLTFGQYYIDNFKDSLTCYVPYSFQVSDLYQAQFNQPFHAKLWTQFYETNIHKKIGKKYSRIKGDNIIVTGYPGVDCYFNEQWAPTNNPWPNNQRTGIKKIIWAPHHTIQGAGVNLNYSSFLLLSEFMLKMAEKYSNSLQIAFKPHPILKENLFNYEKWGKIKTENYFQKWECLDNAFVFDSNYNELFYYSDALIHDSGSFTAEYLALNKPVMFTVNNNEVLNNFNEFGKLCLNQHFLGYTMNNIEEFIKDVVLKEKDPLRISRENFVNEYCRPQNNSASSNIFEFLKKRLN